MLLVGREAELEPFLASPGCRLGGILLLFGCPLIWFGRRKEDIWFGSEEEKIDGTRTRRYVASPAAVCCLHQCEVTVTNSMPERAAQDMPLHGTPSSCYRPQIRTF